MYFKFQAKPVIFWRTYYKSGVNNITYFFIAYDYLFICHNKWLFYMDVFGSTIKKITEKKIFAYSK